MTPAVLRTFLIAADLPPASLGDLTEALIVLADAQDGDADAEPDADTEYDEHEESLQCCT